MVNVATCELFAAEKPTTSATKKTTKKKTKKASPDQASNYDFGFGFGLFNFYPPQPTVQMAYRLNNFFEMGLEAGAFAYTSSQFSASGTYFGVDSKYHPWEDGSFYLGLGLGKRKIVVTTVSQVQVNTTQEDVHWTRTVEQNTISPRIGWQALNKYGNALTFSVGVLVPMGSKVTTSEDPETVEGLPKEEFDREREKKKKDVTSVTGGVLPQLELKYAWYFDWVSN